MNRQESQILKGVAILLMVFLHLFNRGGNVALCHNFFFVGDMPLVHWLHFATNPVPFFLVLSGYGMYCIYQKGKDANRVNRILKIFSHLWVSLLIFTLMAFVFFDVNYYQNLPTVLNNFLSFHCTWNGELWFLFPYVIVMLSSPLIFRFVDKVTIWGNIIIFGCLYVATSYVISRYGSRYLYSNMLVYNPFLVIHMLPAFVFGGLICRSEVIQKLRLKIHNWGLSNYQIAMMALFALLLSVIFVCAIRTSVVYPFYASCFIILFTLMPRWRIVDSVLSFFGKHSLNIWFSHTWFCYYLFHDFVYSFRYPSIIYLVVIALSLLASFGINYILKSIELSTQWLKTKFSPA